MVEHLTENQGVESSILFIVNKFFINFYNWLAQLVEQRPFKSGVTSSILVPSNLAAWFNG